jgi:hypothetical protein
VQPAVRGLEHRVSCLSRPSTPAGSRIRPWQSGNSSGLAAPADREFSKGHQEDDAQLPGFLLPVGSRAGFQGRPGPGHVPLGDGEEAEPGHGPLRRNSS